MSVGLTPKGYIRIWDKKTKRLRMEHDVVWEQAHGSIPNGMQVHHEDGNKANNVLENLRLVTPLEHKRIHGNCILTQGVWYKPCSICKKLKPESEYYKLKSWIMSECKECHVQRAIRDKKRRKSYAHSHVDETTKK